MTELLFNQLVQMQQCLISDLRDSEHLPQTIRDLKALPAEEYPLDEWNQVLVYLLGTALKIDSYYQLKQYLQTL